VASEGACDHRGGSGILDAENGSLEEVLMHVNDWLRVIAGSFVLISVGLGLALSPWFFAFTGFVGLNLLQSGLTGWCPMMTFLRKAGVPD
jgi:hypothetical protein